MVKKNIQRIDKLSFEAKKKLDLLIQSMIDLDVGDRIIFTSEDRRYSIMRMD